MSIRTRGARRSILVVPALASLMTFISLTGTAGAASLANTRPHGAVAFGSNLAKPDVRFGCGVYPTSAGSYATHASQCIWIQVSSGSTRSSVGSDLIPQGNGTVTTASVHVGGTTGPMRFVMVRGFYNVDNGNSSCCVVLLQSKTFTPSRNSVTTEKVNFPIVSNGTIVDGDLEIFDVLGLLLLSPSTPIPLYDQTSLPINTQPADDELFGTIHAGTAQLFYDSLGYQLEIRGSFVKS